MKRQQKAAAASLSNDGYFIYQREREGENRRVADERTRQMRAERKKCELSPVALKFRRRNRYKTKPNSSFV